MQNLNTGLGRSSVPQFDNVYGVCQYHELSSQLDAMHFGHELINSHCLRVCACVFPSPDDITVAHK